MDSKAQTVLEEKIKEIDLIAHEEQLLKYKICWNVEPKWFLDKSKIATFTKDGCEI